MAKKKIPSRLLSIFLIKDGVDDVNQILKAPGALQKHTIAVDGTYVGDLYVRPSKPHTPNWVSLFKDAIDVKKLPVDSSSSAAVLLLEMNNRTFAVAFGQGRHLLEPDCYEENFGLLATVNSVDRNRIRQIDRKRFDAIARLTREQAIRDVPILDFGLELEQDMLRSVTGTPSDSSLGNRLSGRDSLSVSVPVELKNLNNQINVYFKKSKSSAYKDGFSFIDNIDEVRIASEKEELNETLLQRIKDSDFEKIWLVLPDLLDWTDVEGFAYNRADSETVGDIHFSTYLPHVDDLEALSLNTLKRHRVFSINPNGDALQEWPLYRCIYGEIDTKKGTFLLDNGKWYCVDKDLVTRVDHELKQIKATTIALPDYMKNETEGIYNERFAASKTSYALMDRKLVKYGGGKSSIEFCDVFTKSKTMVHVKRYGGSSVLSHLFSQGVVSASLLLWDAGFRKDLNKKLPASHKLADPAARPNPSQYEIAFAVASQSKGKLILPFFSRVTLRNAHRQLSNYGFKVSCTKIDVTTP